MLLVRYVLPLAASALLTQPLLAAADGDIKLLSFNGSVLVKDGASWKTLKEAAAVPAGKLIVSMPRASFASASGAVEMNLLADIGQRGPYPVLESAVVINNNEAVDLDVTFDRGIVVFVNRKDSGPARVAVRFQDQTWQLTLKTPKTRVGMELYSRHMPGLPKIAGGKVEPPVAYLVLLVAEGETFLDTGVEDFALQAPPGPARVNWNSIAKFATIDRLQELPEGITKAISAEEAKLFFAICACASKLTDGDVGPLLDRFLASDDKVERMVGVTLMGAVDDLPRLGKALNDSKHTDARRHAVLVLRHWLGRGPGQVETLYKTLKESKGLNDVQARTVLQLLFGFTEQDRFDAITYELLLAFLNHPQLAVRELAHWNLVRLRPEGRDIAFDAGDPAERRQTAVRQWQELINKQ